MTILNYGYLYDHHQLNRAALCMLYREMPYSGGFFHSCFLRDTGSLFE